MRRYWQYKQRWRQISGFRRWLLPGVLIGALLFRGVAMAEESRKPDFSSLPVPGYATMAPITINYPLTPPLSGTSIRELTLPLPRVHRLWRHCPAQSQKSAMMASMGIMCG